MSNRQINFFVIVPEGANEDPKIQLLMGEIEERVKELREALVVWERTTPVEHATHSVEEIEPANPYPVDPNYPDEFYIPAKE